MQNQFRTAEIEELRVSESIPIGLTRSAITLVWAREAVAIEVGQKLEGR